MKFGTLLILVASIISATCQEFASKYSSGTTGAVVYFEARAGNAMRLVNIDATSDKAASAISWRFGATPTTVAAACSATNTNVITLASALASNDIVLVQNLSGTVTQLTVWGRTQATNKLVSLDNVTGTNLAVGDSVYLKIPTIYRQYGTVGVGKTNFVFDSVTALTNGDAIISQVGASITKYSVYGTSTNTNAVVTLRGPVPYGVSLGDLAYEVTTNYALVVAPITSSLTNLHVASTNGFTNGCLVLIQAATGEMAIRTGATITTTNIAISTAAGFALSSNDVVYFANGPFTNGLPASPGDRRLVMSCSTNITNGVIVAVSSTGGPLWLGTSAGIPTLTNLYNISMTSTNANTIFDGTPWFKLTNGIKLALAAGAADFSMVVSNISTLTNGDAIVICPATGGAFLNMFRGSSDFVVNNVSFTGTNGIGLSAGDSIYTTTPMQTPLGNTTLRLASDGIFIAPKGRPVIVTVDGTSACKINNATVKYE